MRTAGLFVSLVGLVGLVGLLGLLGACAESAPEYPGPPELSLGVGDIALVPIANGDQVPVVRGFQGGTVVWGAATLRYLDPIQLQLDFSITPPAGRASLRSVLVDLDDAGEGFAPITTIGHSVFLPDPTQFSGMPCVLRLEARDRHGRVAADEKTIVPIWSEPPPP